MSRALELQKMTKKIKFERVWGELEAKSCFQRQSLTKYLRQTLVFMWNSAIREKFNFYFSGDFCKYWQKFHFGRRNKHYAWIVLSFEIFLISKDFKSLVVRQFVRQLVCLSLLLIITFRFYYSEKKFYSTIKKSQNNINMIVEHRRV